jgi:hypothetical protein
MAEEPAVLRPAPIAEDVEPDSSIGEIDDPWKLGNALLYIAKQKQRLRFELAGLLREFAEQGCAGDLGYAGFERYCCDRLGFSIRRAQRLIRFREGLDRFRKLAAAFNAGRISYTAVLLLLPVIHRSTEDVWVMWAKDLTYREVERVTEYARTFALPDASAKVLEAWAKGLEEQRLAKRLVDGVSEPTAFAADLGGGRPRRRRLLRSPSSCRSAAPFRRSVAACRASSASRTSLSPLLSTVWREFASGFLKTRSTSPIARSIAAVYP